MGKKKEKNNAIKNSRTRENNEVFRDQIEKKRIKEDDLLGKTRAITYLERTQIFKPVIEEEKEVVLPKLRREVRRSKRTVLVLLILLLVSISLLALFLTFRKKFKDTTIEVGTKDVGVNNFLVSKLYKKKASLVTDISNIDFNRVGEYDVTLKYRGKEQVVKLTVADTTPPEVGFTDVSEYTGYEINPEDFVSYVDDYSEYSVDYKEIDKVDNTKYEDYKIEIIVTDEYGNETSKECILSLGWLKRNVTFEVGEKNIKEKMVVNVKEDAPKIPDSAIKGIDVTTAGEYEVVVNYEGEDYVSKVTVVDTTPPKLKLKDVSVFENAKVNKDSFISSASDNSGKVTTTLKTEIKYGSYGKQTIVIEAKDPSGNVTTKEATFTIKEDKKGPTFSGLSNLSIKKNGSVDYKKGVSAKDNVDGNVDFSYSDSSVKYDIAGTYYVTYTAKDKKGNKTSSKRKITVKHDSSDTNRLVSEYANSIGSDISSIVNGVRKYIKYSASYGEDDPVWYGLNERRGNCFVHAKVLQAVLTKKGITNKLIWTYDRSHYWNLVYVGGAWRHVDSTPGNNYILLTDDEMAAKPPVKNGGGWDTSSFPAAS